VPAAFELLESVMQGTQPVLVGPAALEELESLGQGSLDGPLTSPKQPEDARARRLATATMVRPIGSATPLVRCLVA
jgi:hypothetical protein